MANVKAQMYHHGNLEQALLEAGAREARENGSRNLGGNFLAKKVDVSPMAVYRHFTNAENLRARISQQAREELARRMVAAIAVESDVKNRFQAVGKTYIQFALDEPGLFSTAFVGCDEGPNREDDPSAWLVFHNSIVELCDAGLIAQSEVEQVASFAWAAVHGYSTLAGGSNPMRPTSDETVIDNLLDRIWSGIVPSNKGAKR
jgi:AcrR family transcriptional regulator